MAHGYRAVTWSPFKKAFDVALVAGVAVFLIAFIAAGALTTPKGESFSEIQLLMSALGACAFAMLHLVLAIGPLARLSPRFKPILFNRRHLGVATFLVALAHAGLAILWYHGFSQTNPLVSVFTSNARYDSIQGFPFESLGFVALVILYLMAATSHDFWNTNLGAGVWKTLHMLVYPAYALLVAHVMLGAVQFEKSPVYALATALGAATLVLLHLVTGWREAARDGRARADAAGWVRIGPWADIPEGRAVIAPLASGERVAVFRYDGKVAAVSNVCRHQAGPLGEGCVKDGLVTCPWHGFQYRPEDGCSPPPFTEKIATYRVRITDGEVFVHKDALAPGTPSPPALIEAAR